MWWQNTRDARVLARTFEVSRWLSQAPKDKKKKNARGEKIKRTRVEDNMLFGKLLETKKQKTRRLRLESTGKLPTYVPSNADSEISWLSQSAKILTVKKEKPRLLKKEKDQVNVPTDCNVLEAPFTEISPVDTSISKVKVPENGKSDPLLPRVVVQQLLQFPIYEMTKNSKDQWSNSTKAMTLSAFEDPSCLKYPSVTRILSATMSDEAKAVLERWKMRMIEKLGLRGFEIYQKELFEDGKLLHSIIMSFLTKQEYKVPNKIKQSFLSLNDVLKDVNEVRAVESHVIHPRLRYRGVIDCIANYRGEPCLIDWKKSDKAKNTIGATYDAPLQLASYIGAVNADSKYPFQIKKGLIIVAYTNGEPAKVHEVSEDSLILYWKLWLQRLQDYHIALNPSE